MNRFKVMYDDGSSLDFNNRKDAELWVSKSRYPEWIEGIVDTQEPPVPPPVNTDTEEAEAKFYIIWCPTSDKPPKSKFHLSQAIKVIASMRTKHPGQTFHIMAKVEE